MNKQIIEIKNPCNYAINVPLLSACLGHSGKYFADGLNTKTRVEVYVYINQCDEDGNVTYDMYYINNGITSGYVIATQHGNNAAIELIDATSALELR